MFEELTKWENSLGVRIANTSKGVEGKMVEVVDRSEDLEAENS